MGCRMRAICKAAVIAACNSARLTGRPRVRCRIADGEDISRRHETDALEPGRKAWNYPPCSVASKSQVILRQ